MGVSSAHHSNRKRITFMIWLILALILGALSIGAVLFGLQRLTSARGNAPTKPEEPTDPYDNRSRYHRALDEYKEQSQARELNRRIGMVATVGGGIGLLLALLAALPAMFFGQEAGEAKVLRSVTGEIVGTSTTPGAHFKAPWVDTITFDLTNQQRIYAGTEEEADHMENVDGPRINFKDHDKVSGDIDLAVHYEVDGNHAEQIYIDYASQQGLETRMIDQSIRSVVSNELSKYPTVDVMEKRTEIQSAIGQALAERWKDTGVRVLSVDLQEIDYPQGTKDGFAKAQEAKTAVRESQNRLEVSKAEAERQRVDAEAEADRRLINAQSEAEANRLKSESLTPQVIEQNRIDALRAIGDKGNLVIVPEGSTPMIQAPAKSESTTTP